MQMLASGLNRVSQDMELDSAPQASLVFDRNNHLIFSFAAEDRTSVSLDQVSKPMVSAVLAAEDHNFFRHFGVDLVGVARAAFVNLKQGGVKEGGSTITQQLVRAVALTRDRTLERKIREALLALRVERRFQKAKILEAYLNDIYFGDGHYGVETAARGYFGKSASDLAPAEAALLAGVIRCPSTCSPRVAPALATHRRDTVLAEMHQERTLTDQEYATAVAAPITLVADRRDLNMAAPPAAVAASGDQAEAFYFIETVRRQVLSQFGEVALLRGGLRIHTTIDMAMQKAAEDAMAARFRQINPGGGLEGALVAIDPRNGEVLAMVGGRNFRQSPFNRVTQAKRQPGSAFKPLLFAAAIEQGYAPGSLLTDLDKPINTAQGDWLPSGEHEADRYTLRQALTVSSNRAAVHLMQLIGTSTTQTYARRLGITSPLPDVPSLAIGTADVSLVDLTSAYGAFANDGMLAPHTLITQIEDRTGQSIWDNADSQRPYRAVRPGTAFLMSSMLADVINRGTGTRARAEGFKLPAAGKTGTTDDYGDAWFIGYTPHLVAGVWFGYDEHQKIMDRGFAATVAVPAWARFMMKATAGQKPDWFQEPADVEKVSICRASGRRATESCKLVATADGSPNVYDDYYLEGTAPYENCQGHADASDATVVNGVDEEHVH